MGSRKGRRGSGASTASPPNRLQHHDAEAGWPGRVKVLASSTLSSISQEEGGRTVALTEEDFRKSGFRAKETVAVLAGSRRLIVGRVSPLPSAVLRPGGVGLASASAQSLNCEEAARVRVRRLSDTSVTILTATAMDLYLETVGLPGRAMQPSPRTFLEGLAAGRKSLLHRAAGFCAHGVHVRVGDRLSVSFEGVPYSFRVARVQPSHDTRTTAATGGPVIPSSEGSVSDEIDPLVAPLEKLSIADHSAISALATRASLAAIPSTAVLSKQTNCDGDGHDKISDDGGEPPSGRGRMGLFQVEGVHRDKAVTELPQPSSGAAVVSGHSETTADVVSSSSGETNNDSRVRLEEFYRKHNPEKLDGIDGILSKYAGREQDLFAKLEKKYGVGSSLRAAASGGNIGRGVKEQRRDRSSTKSGSWLSPEQRRLLRPNGRDVKEFTPKAVSTSRNGVGTPSGGDNGGTSNEDAEIRVWGSNETLWLVTSSTSIQLLAADVPSLDDRSSTPAQVSDKVATAGDGSDAWSSGHFGKENAEMNEESDTESGWSAVGGLSSQIQQLKEAIQLPLKSPEILRRFGVRPPRGVLLHGPPGTGKTTLARAAAKACGCHVIVVNGSELMSRFVGESEGALRQTFAEASRCAPCLIVFDEIDTLCPRRDQANSEAQRRVVSTMLALLDGVDAQEQVVVIACTNRPQALDPALRRPGRFDSEVEVGVPDAAGREEILQVLLQGLPHEMDTEVPASTTVGDSAAGMKEKHSGVKGIAARTHGFVGADLQLLVKEAALQALRRSRGDWTSSSQASRGRSGTTESGDGKVVRPRKKMGTRMPMLTPADFHAALPLVSPSGLREVAVEVPSVKWGDIGGMESVKQSLREVVEWPLRHPEAFQRMGMSPPRGVLLYGPPGCSKTLMARALATESGMNFLAVKGPELLSKWLGESERAMQALFKRARAAAPTIIFFDEVDALASKRGAGGEGGAGATERVLTQLLTELDGIQPVKRLVVVAATNRPDVLDPALLRPGRLDRLVYVPPPDMPSRREILRLSLAKVPSAGDVDREEVARRTQGFSGAEVVALCREASICALEEDRSATQVRQTHLLEALGQMRPQITPAVLASYASFHGGAG